MFLDLTGNSIGNAGAAFLLEAIAQSNTLLSLNLSSNELTGGPKKTIEKSFGMSDHMAAKMGPQRLPAMAYNFQTFLGSCSSLLELNLRQNKFGDEAIGLIGEALVGKGSNLENLNIANTQLTSKGFGKLVRDLRVNHTLKKLIADYNNLYSQY